MMKSLVGTQKAYNWIQVVACISGRSRFIVFKVHGRRRTITVKEVYHIVVSCKRSFFHLKSFKIVFIYDTLDEFAEEFFAEVSNASYLRLTDILHDHFLAIATKYAF